MKVISKLVIFLLFSLTGSIFCETFSSGVILDNATVDGARIIWKSAGYNDWRARNNGGTLNFFPGEGTFNALTLLANGKVGIGMSNPAYKLDVAVVGPSADGIVARSSDNRSITLYPSLGAGNCNGIVQAGDSALIYSSGFNSGSFVIAPWANGPSGIRMDANGNVGIGTTNPVAKLHVSGGVIAIGGRNQNGLAFRNSADTANGFYIGRSYFNNNQNDFFINDEVSQTIRLYIDPNGNVGFGTTSPGAKLDVIGNARFGDPSAGYVHIYTTGEHGGVINLYNSDAQKNIFLQNLGGRLRVVNSGWTSEVFNIDQAGNAFMAGNVGIGTTSPGNYKLNVNGSLRANKIVVNTTGADFVFDPNYTLKPLSEVEKYIKSNKHLPEIPSAKEMQQKGADVAELQTKLLSKVEELTLHMIAQEKKLAAQDKKIAALEEENKKLKKTIF